MTDENGNEQAHYAWDPYGMLRNYRGIQPVTDAPHMGYAGGQLDQHTWLTRFGQRWYDPKQGRFTQPDPSGQEANTYLYAQGNTCNKKDPTGLNSCFNDWSTLAIDMIFLGVATDALVEAAAREAPTAGGDTGATILALASTLWTARSVYMDLETLENDGSA